MFCKQCGYNNDKYASVCRRCGSVLRDIGNYAPDAVSPEEEESPAREGSLKLAKKSEPILTVIKKRFKKLEYASDDTKKWLIAACVAGAVIVCLLVFGIVKWAESCSSYTQDIYGSDSSSISADVCAVIDEEGEWIYFSRLYGDNPGLYKTPAGGGEELKLSYVRLSQLLYIEGWIYGTDIETDTLWRIRDNGGTAQQVTEDTVEDVNIVNDILYYIGSDGCVWSGELDDVDDEQAVIAEKLSEKQAMCLTVYSGKIYFIEPDKKEPDPQPTTQVSSSSALPYFGADESDKIVSPYEDTVYGKIIQMNTDGSDARMVGTEKGAFMTIDSGYIYYAVPATVVISTGDVNLITGEPETMDYATLQMRRRSIKGGNTVNFGLENTIGGALAINKTNIFTVSVEGVLVACSYKGGETSPVYTGEADIDAVSIVGNWIYYWADDYTRYCRIPISGGMVETIFQKN